MIIALSITVILIAVFISGKINLYFKFNQQVKTLFLQFKNNSGRKFNYSQLVGLPDPVQRYFKLVLKNDQPYISYARLTHDGQFKMGLDKKWNKIQGEQYFTTKNPGYIWKGVTSIATARDMYISDRGRLIVTLLSRFNIVDGQGKEFDEAEFQRWVCESVWFPTNLLPSESVKWIAIDKNTAELIFNYRELSVNFLTSFNSRGEITQMETRRFMGKSKKEIWIGKMNDYKALNGILIPTRIEAIWSLEKGHFSYAKFNLLKIEYNIPERW